jgi:hypothetical protein
VKALGEVGRQADGVATDALRAVGAPEQAGEGRPGRHITGHAHNYRWQAALMNWSSVRAAHG